MENPILSLLQAAASRAGQEWQSSDKATIPNPLPMGPRELNYNPLSNVPVIGGAINRTVNTPLHALGLLNEGAANIGGATAGELGLLAAWVQAKTGDPNAPATQSANAALAQGAAHPGRAIAALRNGPDTSTALLAGGLEMATNPLNYVGGIGAASKALELTGQAPRLAAVLRNAALAGEVVNRAPLAPLAVVPKLRNILTSMPEWAAPAEGAASALAQGAPEVGRLLSGLGDQAAARDAVTTLSQKVTGKRGGLPLTQIPKVGGIRQYGPMERPPMATLPELGPPPAPPVTMPNEQRVLQLAVLNGGTPSAATIQRELGVGMIEAQRLRDVANGRGVLPSAQTLAPDLGAAVPPATAAPDLAALLAGRPYPTKVAPDLGGRVGDYIRRVRPEVGEPTPPLTALPEAAPAPDLPALPDLPAAPEVGTPAAPLDRQGLVRDTANGPVTNITAVLKDLHNAIYPGQQARFASRALTGLDPTDFHVNDLVAHPDGNAVEPYLDYLIARVQTDPRAAARLAERNPALHGDIAALPAYTGDINAHRQEVQALFGAGKIGALAPEGSALAEQVGGVAPPPDLAATTTAAALPTPAHTGTLDDMRSLILGERDRVGTVYPPSDPAFYARRANVDPAQVPGMLRQLADEGTLGADPVNGYMVKPEAGTPAADVPALSGAQDAAQAVPDVAAPPAATDVQARGKQAIKDLYSESADNLSLPSAARAWHGLGGQLGGAALGGVAGYQQGDTPEERAQNAAKGAFTGMVVGGSAGLAAPELAQLARTIAPQIGQAAHDLADRVPNSAVDPSFWAEALAQGVKEQATAQGNPGVRGMKAVWDAFWAQQRSQVVNTPKQFAQDAFTQATVREGIARREFGVTGQDYQRWIGILRDERSTGTSAIANPLTARLRALGQTDLLADPASVYGIDHVTSITADTRQFGGVGRTVTGAAIGAATGLKTFNPITAALGGVRGYYDPLVSGAVRYINGIQHDAARFSMAEKAMDNEIPDIANEFLFDLARNGVNVKSLENKGGYFSPVEVQALAGKQAADEWQKLVETTIRKQGDRIAFLNGDFRDKGDAATIGDKALKAVSRYVPFASWQVRYTPVLAELAARHPVATLLALRAIGGGVQDAQDNKLKDYQAGTVPISTETPLLGGLARARLGGQAGTMRVDPLGLVVPYGSGTFVAPDTGGGDKTGYQNVTDALGRVGFSPAPPIQAAAYVAGQDYKAPGALSRTAGLEGLADIPPVIARAALRAGGRSDLADQLPDLALPGPRAALDAGRQLLSPVTGAGVSQSDPTTRRYAELVLAETGKPLNDPSNVGLLQQVGESDNPLWQRAIIQSRLTAAAGNATGLVSPVTTLGQTREAVAAQGAGKLPYSSYQVSQAPRALQPALQAANAAATAANPAVATYADITGAGRKERLLAQWEFENNGYKQIAPNLYNQRRQAFLASIK